MNRHIVTYKSSPRYDLDTFLRNAIPGNDGSGCMVAGDPERDVEFTNEWTAAEFEAKCRELCGSIFKSAVTYPAED